MGVELHSFGLHALTNMHTPSTIVSCRKPLEVPAHRTQEMKCLEVTQLQMRASVRRKQENRISGRESLQLLQLLCHERVLANGALLIVFITGDT